MAKNISFEYYSDFFVIFGYYVKKNFSIFIFDIFYRPQKFFGAKTKNDKNNSFRILVVTEKTNILPDFGLFFPYFLCIMSYFFVVYGFILSKKFFSVINNCFGLQKNTFKGIYNGVVLSSSFWYPKA